MSAKANKKFASHRKLFLVGKDAPFSFVEAYKSLRTNLEFLSTTRAPARVKMSREEITLLRPAWLREICM